MMQIIGKFRQIFSSYTKVFRMEHGDAKLGWGVMGLALTVLGFFGKECLDRAPSIFLLALTATNVLCASAPFLSIAPVARAFLYAGAFLFNVVVLPVTHQMMDKHWHLWGGCTVTALVAVILCVAKEVDIGMRRAELDRRASMSAYYAIEFMLPVDIVNQLVTDYNGKFPEAQFSAMWKTLDPPTLLENPVLARKKALEFAKLMLGEVVDV